MFSTIRKRIHTIDIVRGIVMIIMALDHIRDLIHVDYPKYDPLDFNNTTLWVFLTRWVTHLCAPTFVFLSGVSAYLGVLKENDLSKSRKFLIKRGLWLILLEFTLVSFGIFNDLHFNVLLFQVIGAIGFSFVILGLLLSLNAKTIFGIGVAVILVQNSIGLIPESIAVMTRGSILPGAIPLGGERILVIGYPPLSWMAIMFTGFGSGIIFLKESKERRRIFLKIASASLLLFVVLRAFNIYGNPLPWSAKQNSTFTVLSFLDVNKYPPSLLFCLLFLGAMFLLLAWFDKDSSSKVGNILKVYGSVPLFYYIIHWYLIQFIKYVILYLQGYTSNDLKFGFAMARPEGENGLSLGGIYLVWIGLIIVMYPLCKKYSQYKASNKQKGWLKYL